MRRITDDQQRAISSMPARYDADLDGNIEGTDWLAGQVLWSKPRWEDSQGGSWMTMADTGEGRSWMTMADTGSTGLLHTCLSEPPSYVTEPKPQHRALVRFEGLTTQSLPITM